jgi:hypothetical protein
MATLIDYNDISYEISTLKMEIEGMNDDSLIEECNHVLTSNLRSPTMDKIISSYFKKGELTPEQREQAIGFYVLAYGEFGWQS